MARLSRIIVPHTPHHVTQRGNRRQLLFTGAGDYGLYRDLLAERLKTHRVTCLSWCLMPNHVHLILNPGASPGLSRVVGEAHRRYTAFFNARARTTGHLFQGQFNCTALDARGVISVTERQGYILKVRELAKACGAAWLKTAGGGLPA